MTAPSNYFYDGQIRRFVSQFIRMVSNFYVEFGADSSGVVRYQRVPVMYGDPSRQATQILRNNSENTLNAVPAMAVYISGLAYDLTRLQDPSLVQTMQLRQREYDPVTGVYGTGQGEAYTVERMMPSPFKLTLKMDIWTSNTEQKLQLIEQLTTMFNPTMEIQSTDNYIDWTSLSYALLTDLTWSSRTVPTSGEEPIDVAGMTFELPVWISTNIKVKKMGVIQTVIQNIEGLTTLESLGQIITTVGNYGVLLSTSASGNTLKLLKPNDATTNDAYGNDTVIGDSAHPWAPVLDQYGKFISGSSQIRLTQPNGSEAIGAIATHPTDSSLLLYTPFADTLPANTLSPVTAIINPVGANINSAITAPASGTRYLIVNAIGSTNNPEGAVAWRGTDNQDLVANAHDIIQYNGVHWTRVFDSVNTNVLNYVTNLTTGIQYKWQDQQWTKSYDGVYRAGEWMLSI
jgi:T4-like virus Myoviridae tail sheath stabiliser